MSPHLTKDNWTDVMTYGISKGISPALVAQWFADCHFYVPGVQYKPYADLY